MNIYLKFGSTLYLSIFPNIIDTKIYSFHAKRKKSLFQFNLKRMLRSNIHEILKKTETGWPSDDIFIPSFPPLSPIVVYSIKRYQNERRVNSGNVMSSTQITTMNIHIFLFMFILKWV